MCDMGEYEKSEKYLKRLLTSLPEHHSDIPQVYFHLGRVCYFRGDYEQALEDYNHALAFQTNETDSNGNSFDKARILHNIGNIYLDRKQTAKALEYYQK